MAGINLLYTHKRNRYFGGGCVEPVRPFLKCRIDFGAGYRVYFGKDGGTLVILLGGGTKKRQQKDIAAAQESWADYKRRKKQEVR